MAPTVDGCNALLLKYRVFSMCSALQHRPWRPSKFPLRTAGRDARSTDSMGAESTRLETMSTVFETTPPAFLTRFSGPKHEYTSAASCEGQSVAGGLDLPAPTPRICGSASGGS